MTFPHSLRTVLLLIVCMSRLVVLESIVVRSPYEDM